MHKICVYDHLIFIISICESIFTRCVLHKYEINNIEIKTKIDTRKRNKIFNKKCIEKIIFVCTGCKCNQNQNVTSSMGNSLKIRTYRVLEHQKYPWESLRVWQMQPSDDCLLIRQLPWHPRKRHRIVSVEVAPPVVLFSSF